MAVRSEVGFRVAGIADHVALFGEGPSRVVAQRAGPGPRRGAGPGSTPPAWAAVLGQAGGDRLVVEGLLDVPVADAVAAWRDALPRALGMAGLDGLRAAALGGPHRHDAGTATAGRDGRTGTGGRWRRRCGSGAPTREPPGQGRRRATMEFVPPDRS